MSLSSVQLSGAGALVQRGAFGALLTHFFNFSALKLLHVMQKKSAHAAQCKLWKAVGERKNETLPAMKNWFKAEAEANRATNLLTLRTQVAIPARKQLGLTCLVRSNRFCKATGLCCCSYSDL